ncbi:hypothetical protein PR048_029197 [Dryococelus australis]|uniref:Integrase catalytic domain-containing protein n=1 Tax=Dryococelus australis TaxID=614101 RepID=A0ABQ9GD09_9NEOP|nr:hypothetical protein PR048_029197 [Dryococelus australis]
MDIYELTNVRYLVVQNYFLRFLEVMKLDRLSSEAVILRVKNIFGCHGIPETVSTDGGAQFTAENSVKEMDLNLGLLAYRATPLESCFSPAELVLGWILHTTLPQASSSLQFRTCDLHIKERYKRNYDAGHEAYELDPLHPGAHIWITGLRRYCKVFQPADWFRSYVVATETRNVR